MVRVIRHCYLLARFAEGELHGLFMTRRELKRFLETLEASKDSTEWVSANYYGPTLSYEYFILAVFSAYSVRKRGKFIVIHFNPTEFNELKELLRW
jgi:hypothetical protein